MRKIALEGASKAQGVNAELLHAHAPQNNVRTVMELKSEEGERLEHTSKNELLKPAKDCTINELVKNNVVSSRIRLARNVTGLEFPRNIKVTDERVVDLINGAYKAANGVFEARLLPMNKLGKEQKRLL